MKYHASVLSLSVRRETGGGIGADLRCRAAQDNFTFLDMLETLWNALMHENGQARLKKVSVTLSGLQPDEAVQQDLFDAGGKTQSQQKKHDSISEAMDKVNKKYGRDTVALGIMPQQGRSFSGTKVAFTRIPDMDEFME
jgi:DNA polymerase IV